MQEIGIDGVDQRDQHHHHHHHLSCSQGNCGECLLQRSSYGVPGHQSGVHRQHQCPGCGKAFATSSGLKQHQHIHSSVKPFRCDVCHKAYTQFSNLCRHKRMHADCRQRIRCPDCDQTFATTTSLAKHRRFCDALISPATSSRRSRLHHAAVDPACGTTAGPSESCAVDESTLLVTSGGWGVASLLPLMTSEPAAFNCADPRDTSDNRVDEELIKKSQSTTKQPSDFGIRRLLECRSSDEKKTSATEDVNVEDVNETGPASSECDDSDDIINDELQDEPLDLSTRSTARLQEATSNVDAQSHSWDTSPSTAAVDRPPSDDGNVNASSLGVNSPFELERSLVLPSMSLTPATLLGSLFYERLQQQQQRSWIDSTAGDPFHVLRETSTFAGSKMLTGKSPVDLLRCQSDLDALLSRPMKSYTLEVGIDQKDARRQAAAMSAGQRQQAPHRYGCRFCGKMFPRSANLTRHLRTHTGEQPYRCCYCERSFSISSNLQRHVRNIHNRERPFSCPLCERCFGQQTNLDRHLKKHEIDAAAAASVLGGGVGHSTAAVRVRSPPGRDVSGESYLLELRRFVVRACGMDDTCYQTTRTSTNVNEPQHNAKSSPASLLWTPARQPTLHEDEQPSEVPEPVEVEVVADNQPSRPSSAVDESRSPTCDDDGDGLFTSSLSDALRLVPNIKSPIQSVVC